LESLSNAYGDIAQKLPPIAGVVQGAMVLHDTPIRDMTFELFQKVLRPKVLGSINLNQIFHQPDLDFFIYFSSMTGVVGNIGQANYTTANSFMMSQAAQRRKNGLSGSVINIGAIIGVGYVTRELSQANQDNLFKGGYTFMSEPAFHQAFSEAIVAGRPGSRIDPEISTGLRVVSRTESNPPVWVDNPRFSHHIIPDAAEVENSAVEGDSMSINMRLQRCTTFSDLKVVIFGQLFFCPH
jgi:hybrid polyketide synthase/nonribosomal peptide synthetase ACE1